MSRAAFARRSSRRLALRHAESVLGGDAGKGGHTAGVDAREVARIVVRVKAALVSLGGEEVKLYAKRIDSTLRGNLGRETDAFLDVLGPDYIAVCVPCFPSSGRVLVGGYLLVNGVPLQKTEVAKDPKNPITTSSAKQLYQAQSRYPLETIHLDDIAKGVESLAARMNEAVERGARILVCDSVSMEDMETIVDALIAAKLKFIPVETIDQVFAAALTPMPEAVREETPVFVPVAREKTEAVLRQ